MELKKPVQDVDCGVSVGESGFTTAALRGLLVQRYCRYEEGQTDGRIKETRGGKGALECSF